VFYAHALGYVITRHADIAQVFGDPATYSSAVAQAPLVPRIGPHYNGDNRLAMPLTTWSRGHGNAPRSDAGWVRREINCTAGWSCTGRSWRWHGPWVAIRSSTDERRAQTRGASKRVRGLLSGASKRVRGLLSGASKRVRGLLSGASKRVRGLLSGASKRVRGLLNCARE